MHDNPEGEYTLAMPSKTKPIAIRFPAEQIARIDAWARDAGRSRHSAVLLLVGIGLDSPVDTPEPKPRTKAKPDPKAVLTQAEAKAQHLATPKPTPRRWALPGVQLGPTASPPGSRLKAKK